MKISFVIPCYRSEHTVEGVVSEIKSVVAQRPEVDYEIIMVSDHSPDNVYSVIERMCQADPKHLKGLELARNFGQHAALMAGYARTSGDLVFSLDDDGQAPVESIYALTDALEKQKVDVVYGEYPVKKHNIFRNLGSDVNHLMSVWLLGWIKGKRGSSFYVAKRYVIDVMLKYQGPYPYLGGLVLRITRSIGFVDVQHRARVEGKSGYTFSILIKLWSNGFTAFSVKPLRLATWTGFLCATCGFLAVAWTIIRKLFICPETPMGYSSLMAVILFIGGLMMLMLGLIGEYIGRIYICINQSPQYIVAKETT